MLFRPCSLQLLLDGPTRRLPLLNGTPLVAEYLPSLRNGIELCFRVWARYVRALRAR